MRVREACKGYVFVEGGGGEEMEHAHTYSNRNPSLLSLYFRVRGL